MRYAALFVLLLSTGCEGEPPATAPTSKLSVVPPTAAPRSTIKAPGAGYSDAQVPVAEDFELDAAKAITADNYKAELARIEAEIAGVEPPLPAPAPKGKAP